MDYLIAEDLLLILLDDEKGTRTTSFLDLALGGAVLADLALAGAVVVEEKTSMWHSAKVSAVAGQAPEDPLLLEAYVVVAEKERAAENLVSRLGKGAKDRLATRLVERGVLQRREDKVLGLFPRTRWPAADTVHEGEVRLRLTAVIVQGLTPDARTGALIALLGAIGNAHKVVDSQVMSGREIRRRAKEIGEGVWAAGAVRAAINASTAAIAAVAGATGGGAAVG